MYRELYLQAEAVRELAYAPYSNFKVGAAVLTKEGVMYTGVNIENSSFPAGICAEQVALSKAISQGERNFEAIAICGNDGIAWPCGICRQFLYEFAPEIKVITGEDEDHLEIETLTTLLPKGFTL
ncbi:MAG: cytidine deaminase [Anaerovoracaceae bacterium]